MNHLAHAFLAPDSPEARVGSILGDFVRGVRVEALPENVRRGVRHHFAVDRFTDRHPEVLASKAVFSRERRRFAGVALDMLYDHFLLRHWHRFSDQDPDRFILRLYGELSAHEALMPPRMVEVTRRTVCHDGFRAYRDLEQVGQALDRVASRVRFANRFQGIIEEILRNRQELEDRFLKFFPDLQKSAENF